MRVETFVSYSLFYSAAHETVPGTQQVLNKYLLNEYVQDAQRKTPPIIKPGRKGSGLQIPCVWLKCVLRWPSVQVLFPHLLRTGTCPFDS